MDPAKVEAIVRGFARACAEFSLPPHRRRDRGDAGHLRRGRLRPRRLHRGRRGEEEGAAPGRGRRRHPAGAALRGPPHERVLAGPQGALRSPRPPRGHPPARAGDDGGRGPARPAPQLPRRSRAAARARQDQGALPHHGGGFPGNLPRVLPAGLGALVRRGSWEVPPLFRLIERGGKNRGRRDVPDLQHGRRHGGSRRPRGSPRGRAFPRAPRRDELRHRLRGGGRGCGLRVTRGRRPRLAAGAATCRPSSTPRARGGWAAKSRSSSPTWRPPRPSSARERPGYRRSSATIAAERAKPSTGSSWPCSGSTEWTSCAWPASCAASRPSCSGHFRAAWSTCTRRSCPRSPDSRPSARPSNTA